MLTATIPNYATAMSRLVQTYKFALFVSYYGTRKNRMEYLQTYFQYSTRIDLLLILPPSHISDMSGNTCPKIFQLSIVVIHYFNYLLLSALSLYPPIAIHLWFCFPSVSENIAKRFENRGKTFKGYERYEKVVNNRKDYQLEG